MQELVILVIQVQKVRKVQQDLLEALDLRVKKEKWVSLVLQDLLVLLDQQEILVEQDLLDLQVMMVVTEIKVKKVNKGTQ